MRSLIREPLIHFLLLAGVVFAIEYFVSAQRKEQIVVDQQTAEFLIEQRSDLELRDLSPKEQPR